VFSFARQCFDQGAAQTTAAAIARAKGLRAMTSVDVRGTSAGASYRFIRRFADRIPNLDRCPRCGCSAVTVVDYHVRTNDSKITIDAVVVCHDPHCPTQQSSRGTPLPRAS